MKFVCLQEKLKQVLNIAERIITRNLTLPILNNILLSTDNNKLKISSTNLEIGINCWIPGKIEKEGKLTVPAKVLSSFVSSLPNKKIELKVKNNQLIIKCENHQAIIKGLDPKDFPIIPQIKNKPLLKVNNLVFKTGLSQIIDLVSLSETRPEITGVCFRFDPDQLILAATDSFRLGEKTIKEIDDIDKNQIKTIKEIIIPQRTIQELIRVLNEKNSEGKTNIVLGENQVLFDLNDVQIISRLIDGQYPDYQQVIPKEFQTQFRINKQALIENIRLASFFSGKNNEVRLLVKPSKSIIEISSQDIDLGEHKSQISGEIEGVPVEIAFNYKYLLDGLNNIFSDKVNILIGKEMGKTLIKPVGDETYLYVLMPIKS